MSGAPQYVCQWRVEQPSQERQKNDLLFFTDNDFTVLSYVEVASWSTIPISWVVTKDDQSCRSEAVMISGLVRDGQSVETHRNTINLVGYVRNAGAQ